MNLGMEMVPVRRVLGSWARRAHLYEIVTRVPIPASEVCQEAELIKQSCSSLGPREA